MFKDVFPSKDESFDLWQANLITILVAHVTLWQLGSLTAILAAQGVWSAAWAAAHIKTARTPGQTAAKRVARDAYEALLRPYIQQYIMVNPLITIEDYYNMEIKPRDTQRTPVPAPTTLPEVSVTPLMGNRLKIYFRQQPDAQGVSKRGKPAGVKFCEFAYAMGEVPQSPDDCDGKELITRSPYVADFAPQQAGQKLFFFARWVNPNGKPGPWTELVQAMVP